MVFFSSFFLFFPPPWAYDGLAMYITRVVYASIGSRYYRLCNYGVSVIYRARVTRRARESFETFKTARTRAVDDDDDDGPRRRRTARRSRPFESKYLRLAPSVFDFRRVPYTTTCPLHGNRCPRFSTFSSIEWRSINHRATDEDGRLFSDSNYSTTVLGYRRFFVLICVGRVFFTTVFEKNSLALSTFNYTLARSMFLQCVLFSSRRSSWEYLIDFYFQNKLYSFFVDSGRNSMSKVWKRTKNDVLIIECIQLNNFTRTYTT